MYDGSWLNGYYYFPAYYPTGRHNGGDNFAFVDGHAKWYNTQEYRDNPGIYHFYPIDATSALDAAFWLNPLYDPVTNPGP